MNPAAATGTMTAGADGLSVEHAILTRIGGRAQNEDACGVWRSADHLCWVLADGAGGHGSGDVAAQLAVDHVLQQYAAAPLGSAQEVWELIHEINAVVISHRADSPAQRDMHSTVISLFFDLVRREAIWGHAGDSRLYAFRQGQMVLRTSDHSTVQAMVDAGLLGADSIAHHPARSELRSALGMARQELTINVPDEPWSLQAGDVFLLCSDGLWEHVDDAALCASLAESAGPADWLARLERLVLAVVATRGSGHFDNFSGIAVWVDRLNAPTGEGKNG